MPHNDAAAWLSARSRTVGQRLNPVNFCGYFHTNQFCECDLPEDVLLFLLSWRLCFRSRPPLDKPEVRGHSFAKKELLSSLKIV